ncbi:MAG: hypothetical protein MUF70_16390, partial [Myxococcota bacterium]|nr:hypothetical protein [Myxococcota bacterium]
MNRFTLALALALTAGLAAAPPASAQAGATDPGAASTEAEDETAAWMKQLEDARLRLRDASERVDRLENAKGRGAARRYPRGDAKAAYLADLAAARAERDDARRSYPDIVDDARRAGVPPGLLSDYEEEAETALAAAEADDETERSDDSYEAENTDLSEYEAAGTDDV